MCCSFIVLLSLIKNNQESRNPFGSNLGTISGTDMCPKDKQNRTLAGGHCGSQSNKNWGHIFSIIVGAVKLWIPGSRVPLRCVMNTVYGWTLAQRKERKSFYTPQLRGVTNVLETYFLTSCPQCLLVSASDDPCTVWCTAHCLKKDMTAVLYLFIIISKTHDKTKTTLNLPY